MSGKAVELTVAGQKCRVVTTASETELALLAAMVEEKLRGVLTPGRSVDTRAMLLAAVALAADAREQRARADAIAATAKATLQGLLERIDDALEQSDARSSELGMSRRGRREAQPSQTAQASDAGGPGSGAKAPRREAPAAPEPPRATTTRRRGADKHSTVAKEDGAT